MRRLIQYARRYAGAGAVLLLIAGGVLLFVRMRTSIRTDEAADAGSVFRVRQGPLTISVTETGTIKPSAQETIKNELEGRTTILYLIPEGTHVEAGDLLVELDASSLQDSKLDQEIRVRNAEAAFVQSRENLEIVKNQAQSDMDKAELDFRFAREDLAKYREGEYPNQLKDQEGRITLAQEELQRAEESLKWSRVLYEDKYIAESELQADELQVKKARLDLDLAGSELDLLTEYTYPRRVAELESNVKQTDMALERVKRKSAANIVQAEADLRAKQSEYERQTDKLDKIEKQIAKARIVAPRDGLVIYATSTQFSWRGDTEPLAEGQEVRERQELIYLPTTSTFTAEVSIHESSLEKIRAGLPVRLTVDALPGRVFRGTVKTIAPLPDPTSVFMNPDLKVYKTEVAIDGGGDVLRTGMSCQAEILIEEYDPAVFVPVQCVVRIGGRPTVFVMGRGRPNPRPVQLGLDNNRMVHILDGIDAGEEVLLAPPLEAGANGEGVEGPVGEPDAETVSASTPPEPSPSRGRPSRGARKAQP
jgi:HlyD family secretion protein